MPSSCRRRKPQTRPRSELVPFGASERPSSRAHVLFSFLLLYCTASCSTTGLPSSCDTRRDDMRVPITMHNPSRPHCLSLSYFLLHLSSRTLGQHLPTQSRHLPPRGSRTLSPFYLILVLPVMLTSSLYSIPITDTPEIATTIQNPDKAEGQHACI
jgi:hypothetical protein